LLTDYVYYAWTTANGRGRLSEIKTGTTGDATSLQSLVYQYDAVGNVTQIDDYKAGLPQYHTFQYDALNRLTQAQASGGSYGDYGADTYQYSFSGNLTSKAGQTLSYTDTLHAHAVGAVSNGDWFTYDANGSMTTRYVSGRSFTLTYDEESHLTAASGGVAASFVYDGDGKRVKATVDGVATGYVGDWYEVYTATKKYYAIGGQRVAMDDDGTLFFLLGDHLGSTSITADSSGSFVAELRYKAWGESRYTSGTTPTSYRFTGQREESALGLYFYNARWYDPSLGRFVQADTVMQSQECALAVSYTEQGIRGRCAGARSTAGTQSDTQALNRYTYTLNNPVRYTDPSGHIIPLAAAAWMGAAGLIGGVSNALTYVASAKLGGEQVNLEKVGIAFGTGFAVGAVTAIPGAGIPLSIAAGAAGNTIQYSLTRAVDGEDISAGGLVGSAFAGGIGGWIAGPFGQASALREAGELAGGNLAKGLASGALTNGVVPSVESAIGDLNTAAELARGIPICSTAVCPPPTPLADIIPGDAPGLNSPGAEGWPYDGQ